jgi:ATP-dependent Clp protease ATP-binding subunit ClpB
MKLFNNPAVLALFVLVATSMDQHSAAAFVPSKNRALSSQNTCKTSHAFTSTIRSAPSSTSFVQRQGRPGAGAVTELRMAAEDFSEAKYTEAAWASIAALTKVADYYSTSSIEAPYLLDVLLNPNKHGAGEDAEAARRVIEKTLAKASVDVNKLRSELEKYLAKQPRVSDNASKSMGRSLQKVLDVARSSKEILGDSFVSTEGLLLALIKVDERFTQEALLKQGINYTDVLDVVRDMRVKSGPVISRSAEKMYEALMKYGIDFTEKAREGKLDPVIGRDDEIRRAVVILSRRTKNNPVLIGDPGVGKTAIAEGIAQRIVVSSLWLLPACVCSFCFII